MGVGEEIKNIAKLPGELKTRVLDKLRKDPVIRKKLIFLTQECFLDNYIATTLLGDLREKNLQLTN